MCLIWISMGLFGHAAMTDLNNMTIDLVVLPGDDCPSAYRQVRISAECTSANCLLRHGGKVGKRLQPWVFQLLSSQRVCSSRQDLMATQHPLQDPGSWTTPFWALSTRVQQRPTSKSSDQSRSPCPRWDDSWHRRLMNPC